MPNVTVRKSDGSTFSFELPNEGSVLSVKEKLSPLSGIPTEDIRLVYSGRVLNDQNSIDTYNIIEGGILFLLRNPKPHTTSGVTIRGGALKAEDHENDVMSSMMDNPMMKNLMSNPEFIKMILDQPALRQLRDKHPELNSAFENPTLLKEMMENMMNPEMRKEMTRNMDHAMQKISNTPGGFQHLASYYHDMDEFQDALMKPVGADADKKRERIYNQRNEVTDEEMPNPWAAPTSSSQTAPSRGMTAGMTNPAFLSSLFAQPPAESSSSPFTNVANQNSNSNNATTPPSSMPANPFASLMTMMMQSRNNNAAATSSTAPTLLLNPLSIFPPSAQSNSTALTTNQTANQGVPSSHPTTTTTPPINPLFSSMMNNFQQQQAHHLNGSTTPVVSSAGVSGPPLNPMLQMMQMMMSNRLNNHPESGVTAPAVPPRERFQEQLARLRDMGFDNEEVCLKVLVRVSGNLNRAIDELLSGKTE